ncbi:MAG TPA: amidase family protein [Candidatus Angelobacter sp.]
MKTTFDPNFGSALDAAAAIRAKQISSVELTQHTFDRIDAFQPRLNAYVYQLREHALAAAQRADEAPAREVTGIFHGVPINVKESFGVQGQPCTWGIPAFKDAKAPMHSVAVRRLLEAGAILLGATNVPLYLMDGQSFNEIYGVTNNPWNLALTPGGSSGGSAASLAAGMAFLSVGSDIGGSIRTPASFCGIYGHKPTLDIVSQTGHLPGGMQSAPGFSTLMAVAGPMARSAEDLEAALRVLAGPEPPASKAWQWTLPLARQQDLRDFRVGYVLEDPAVPVSAETKAVLDGAIRACEKAGATLHAGWPDGFRFQELLDAYHFHLGAFDFSVMPPGRQQGVRPKLEKRSDFYAQGALAGFAAWQGQNLKRLVYRALWQKFFETADVFLLPTAFTTAFPHSTEPVGTRMLPTPEGGSQKFGDLISYICPATLTGCPATTAPAGLSKSGLPVGLQIMGPYLEDATPIRFAGLLAREIGGFQAPKGYEKSS